MTDNQIYAEAGKIIQIAMGKVSFGSRNPARREWAANEDPLAYVMGVQAIVSLVQRATASLVSGYPLNQKEAAE